MTDTLPAPQNPETHIDEVLIDAVCTKAEELLEGVNSQVEEFSIPDLGLPGGDVDDRATLNEYTSAHRSVSFPMTMQNGQLGTMYLDQITEQGSAVTKVMFTYPNLELSVGDKKVFVTEAYEIDKNPADHGTASATYRTSNNVSRSDKDLPEPSQDIPVPDVNDPDWAKGVLGSIKLDVELDKLQPQLDDDKLRELLRLMDGADISMRNIEVGTNIDTIDLRGIA